jgi:hypothetical protein
MSTVKPLYGSNNQPITITLASLANGAYRACAAIDNTANLFDDIKVQFKAKTGASVAGTPIITVFMGESADGGTNYSDGITPADAVVTPSSPPNLKYLGTLSTPVAATAYVSDPFSFKRDVGLWTVPDKWFLVFLNGTGAALDATNGSFSVFWAGINPQIV